MTVSAPKPQPTPATAAPSGKSAPTKPPAKVDPAVQETLLAVEPQQGFALVRLVLASEREAELGFPAGTEAMLDAAMLRIERTHSSDDMFVKDFPVGAIVFASLDGLAPLLATHLFLLPLERVQGMLPTAADSSAPMGFQPTE